MHWLAVYSVCVVSDALSLLLTQGLFRLYSEVIVKFTTKWFYLKKACSAIAEFLSCCLVVSRGGSWAAAVEHLSLGTGPLHCLLCDWIFPKKGVAWSAFTSIWKANRYDSVHVVSFLLSTSVKADTPRSWPLSWPMTRPALPRQWWDSSISWKPDQMIRSPSYCGHKF